MARRVATKQNPPVLEGNPTLAIEWWDTDRPKDYPQNARKWAQKAVDKVALSLREFGFRQPVVVDKDGVIIIGHLRRRSAKQEGFAQIPVHVATELSPEKVRQLRLMDNRSHDEAEWDMDILAAEMKELAALNLDLSLTGFNEAEFVSFVAGMGATDPDEAPAPPAVPASRPGDLWILGDHRLLCGDCTVKADVERVLGGRKPLLLVTDPPYGISLDSEWRDRAGLGTGRDRTTGHTETTVSGDTRIDWSAAFELVPSLMVAYVWHASVGTRQVLNGLERIGFVYPQQIIWNKGRTVLTRTHYWYQHEPCWYVRKPNAPWYGKAGENSTVWDAASPKFIMGGSDEEKFDHPTQKPVDLMTRSIVNHLQPRELVYEPFGGSGTTLMAAQITGRACCCIELEPRYIDVIIARWQNFTQRDAVLDGDGRTFAAVAAERKDGVPSPTADIDGVPSMANPNDSEISLAASGDAAIG